MWRLYLILLAAVFSACTSSTPSENTQIALKMPQAFSLSTSDTTAAPASDQNCFYISVLRSQNPGSLYCENSDGTQKRKFNRFLGGFRAGEEILLNLVSGPGRVISLWSANTDDCGPDSVPEALNLMDSKPISLEPGEARLELQLRPTPIFTSAACSLESGLHLKHKLTIAKPAQGEVIKVSDLQAVDVQGTCENGSQLTLLEESVTCENESYSFTLDLSNEPEGNFDFEVVSVLREKTKRRTRTIVKDTTAPSQATFAINDGDTVAEDINFWFQFTAEEPLSEYCVLSVNDSSLCVWKPIGPSMRDKIPQPDGTASLFAFVKDLAGNISAPLQDSILLYSWLKSYTYPISQSITHGCLIDSKRDIYCWGQNTTGQLGIGSRLAQGVSLSDIPELKKVSSGDLKAKSIHTMPNSTCALFNDQRVRCWGQGTKGKTGLGSTLSYADTPTETVASLPGIDFGPGRSVLQLSIISTHGCALLDNFQVKCWGDGLYGALGIGSTTNIGDQAGELGASHPAVSLGSGRSARAVGAGGNFSCALLDDNSLKCWGRGSVGRLGQESTTNLGDGGGELGDNLSPIALGSGRTVREFKMGFQSVCTLLDNDDIKCFGSGSGGVLGNGSTQHKGDGSGEMGDALPVTSMGTGRKAKSLSAGNNHYCAILDDDSVKCWGINSTGQLGYGDVLGRGGSSTNSGDNLPRLFLGLDFPISGVYAGGNQTCLVSQQGAIKCMGDNADGQLPNTSGPDYGDSADETPDNLSVIDFGPGKVPVDIAVGGYHSCATMADGSAKCWGSNSQGGLGNENLLPIGLKASELGAGMPSVLIGDSFASVQTGFNHTCGRLQTGALKCWGDGLKGATALGSTSDKGRTAGSMSGLPAVDLGSGLTATKVLLSQAISCALLSNNKLKCWGDAASNGLGQGNTSNKGDGGGEMGDNLSPINLGTGRTVVDFGIGDNFGCALLDNSDVKCWGAGTYGRLGRGSTAAVSSAAQMGDNLTAVDFGTGFTPVKIGVGSFHACALSNGGQLKCWGGSSSGQLGQGSKLALGSNVAHLGDNLPVVDFAGQTIADFWVGPNNTCVKLANNEIKCFGKNGEGQLGYGHTLEVGTAPENSGTNLPSVSFGALGTPSKIALGFFHTCALFPPGRVVCYGSNDLGQLAIPFETKIGGSASTTPNLLAPAPFAPEVKIWGIDSI